jgi:4-hydroxy-2-oxoheptanedioate aldolase
MLPGASLARMVAQMGFDVSLVPCIPPASPPGPWLTFRQFVIIDTEHGNIADDEMHIAVGVIASQGVSPIVRIPAPENWIVKRTLDTGGK